MRTELARTVDEATIHNVRMALERGWRLGDDIQPTIRMLVAEVRQLAAKRNVSWKDVFDEVVTGEAIRSHDAMGGTDHPDPTLHSSPIESER